MWIDGEKTPNANFVYLNNKSHTIENEDEKVGTNKNIDKDFIPDNT